MILLEFLQLIHTQVHSWKVTPNWVTDFWRN